MVHIAVIGAGTAGLCAAKTAIQSDCEVTVFEQAKQVGGTWVYDDNIGQNEHGLDIHTSMYQGLQYVTSFFLLLSNSKSNAISIDIVQFSQISLNKFLFFF